MYLDAMEGSIAMYIANAVTAPFAAATILAAILWGRCDVRGYALEVDALDTFRIKRRRVQTDALEQILFAVA